jgi:hypothetical protein
MSWTEEALKRVSKVVKLQQDCAKYLQMDGGSLASQILLGLLKATAAKQAPVKLSEIVDAMYGKEGREKQDVVRLTMEKTLLKCGIVEKIYVGERDVRYFPAAYRFQEVSRSETSSGSKTEQLVGAEVRLPAKYWAVPAEAYQLIVEREACMKALDKLEEDVRRGSVDAEEYRRMKEGLTRSLSETEKRLKNYGEIVSLID